MKVKIVAKEQPVWKSALGWALYVVAVLILVVQQCYHIFSFPGTYDKLAWVLVIFAVMSAGITNILGSLGVGDWFKRFFIAFGCIVLVCLLMSSGGLLYDSTTGSNLFEGSAFYVLNSMSENITAWGAIANIIMACIPIAIIIITIVFITMSEHAKEYAESIISGVLCIAFYIGVAYLMNLTLGINIFAPF
jgi:hypothetical protein